MTDQTKTPGALKRQVCHACVSMPRNEHCGICDAPQPPALGGEPEVLGWVVTDMNGDFYFAANRQTSADTPLIDRAHLAPYQAEIERLWALCLEKDERMAAMNESWSRCISQRDQLKARNAELLRLLGLAWGADDVFAADCKKIDAALSNPEGEQV